MFIFRNDDRMENMPPEELKKYFQLWMDWVAGLQAQGCYIGGEPLEDRPAKVVRGEKGITITDGPYMEAKEVVGGYMLIRAKNITEAVEISAACPGLKRGGSVEVRQVQPIPE